MFLVETNLYVQCPHCSSYFDPTVKRSKVRNYSESSFDAHKNSVFFHSSLRRQTNARKKRKRLHNDSLFRSFESMCNGYVLEPFKNHTRDLTFFQIKNKSILNKYLHRILKVLAEKFRGKKFLLTDVFFCTHSFFFCSVLPRKKIILGKNP